MITDCEPLANALRKEVQEYGGLLNLFDRQQEAILGRNPDLLLAITDLLEAQAQTIESCCRERECRVRILAEELEEPQETSLRELTALCSEPVRLLLGALIDEINSLVARTKHRARQNQMLLARSIDVSQQILQRLNPGGVIKTYSNTGRASIAVAGAARSIATT